MTERNGVSRRALLISAPVGAAFALVAGCSSSSSTTSSPTTSAPATGSATTSAPATGSATTSASAPVPSSTTPSAAPTSAQPSSPGASPSATPTTSAAPQKLKVGTKGAEVLALQQRLTDLGYWIAKADGSFGDTTQQAVFALQKAAGLGRDGTVGPKTQKALDDGVRPSARSASGSGHLIEINLEKQLLMVVDGGKVTTILNTSTGSNQHYTYDGGTYLADTPPGHFKVGRQIDGWRHGPLGPLWRPKYFNGGIAVHGAPSVPAYPASHGCARVSISAMNWIWATGKIPLKTKVWVYTA